MTIEIKQLVIRAVVEARREPAAPRAIDPPRERAPRSEPAPALSAEEREAMIAACVREVLRKLERARER